jgi:hypothetical protein
MEGVILVSTEDILFTAVGTDQELALRREVDRLADELNSVLPDYEVAHIHLDTGDYLGLRRVDPEEGSYWRARFAAPEGEEEAGDA